MVDFPSTIEIHALRGRDQSRDFIRDTSIFKLKVLAFFDPVDLLIIIPGLNLV